MITMVGEDVASTDEMEISAEDVEVSTLEAQGASRGKKQASRFSTCTLKATHH